MLTPAPCDIRPGSRACSAWYVAGRLGHRERSFAWIANQIQKLVDHEGFPPPIVRYTGTRKTDGITTSSRWNLDAVEAWFDGLVPPQLLAAHQADIAERYAATLDGRAAQMAGAEA